MSRKLIKRGAPHFDIRLTGLHAAAACAVNGRCDSNRCAIKQAIEDQVLGAEFIRVDAVKIAFSVGDRRLEYDTPRNARRALILFDETGMVEHDEMIIKLRKGKATVRGFLATHEGYASGRLVRPKENKDARTRTRLSYPKLRTRGFCIS